MNSTRKLFSILSAFLLMTLFANAQSADEAWWESASVNTTEGTTLIPSTNSEYVYEVDFYGDKYDFIVNFEEISREVTFNYEMTNPDNTSGNVSISNEAMTDAIKQVNTFSGGELNLDSATTVLVSVDVLRKLVEEGEAGMRPTPEPKTFMFVKKSLSNDYTVLNHGKEIDDLSVVKAVCNPGPHVYYEYHIHASSSFPLILYMDLGWSIRLKEIRAAAD